MALGDFLLDSSETNLQLPFRVLNLGGRAPPVDHDHEAYSRSNSNQDILRRSKLAAYRCFLPDLTGFTGFRRAGPGSQHFSRE